MPLARVAQNSEFLSAGGPLATTTSTGATVNVAGAHFARIIVDVEPGSNAGTTNGLGAFELQGSTATSGTGSFTPISGYTGTTATEAGAGEFLLSEFETASGDPGTYTVDVDLRGRELERLQLVAAADNINSNVTAVFGLFGPNVTPDNQSVVRPADL